MTIDHRWWQDIILTVNEVPNKAQGGAHNGRPDKIVRGEAYSAPTTDECWHDYLSLPPFLLLYTQTIYKWEERSSLGRVMSGTDDWTRLGRLLRAPVYWTLPASPNHPLFLSSDEPSLSTIRYHLIIFSISDILAGGRYGFAVDAASPRAPSRHPHRSSLSLSLSESSVRPCQTPTLLITFRLEIGLERGAGSQRDVQGVSRRRLVVEATLARALPRPLRPPWLRSFFTFFPSNIVLLIYLIFILYLSYWWDFFRRSPELPPSSLHSWFNSPLWFLIQLFFVVTVLSGSAADLIREYKTSFKFASMLLANRLVTFPRSATTLPLSFPPHRLHPSHAIMEKCMSGFLDKALNKGHENEVPEEKWCSLVSGKSMFLKKSFTSPSLVTSPYPCAMVRVFFWIEIDMS